MSRPRKKPDYNAENIMNELLTDVTEYYTSSPKVSLCNIANEFDITLLKARKLLITAGAYATETSAEVQQLREDGKTIPEIMNLTGLSRASVHSYLPYKKGIYNAKETSLDADRCRIYRQRKAAVERLKDDPDNQPFGFAVLLAILFMFVYLTAEEQGRKVLFRKWCLSFKNNKYFRRLFYLSFYSGMILFQTLLNRNMWANPLSNVMGSWGLMG